MVAHDPAKFSYQLLKQPKDIRLLELFPGHPDETIRCSLSHRSLTSNPCYHAVSYTWGSPGSLCAIELNGIAHPVQPNLFEFLQQLRKRLTGPSITLWVDALCINQTDLLEKNVQVPLMGLIYSTAESVLVWLGPEADGSKEYFNYRNHGRNTRTESENPSKIPHRQQFLDKWATIASMSNAIAALQRRDYWTRTWIIQEIVLARHINVFCGNQSTAWPHFCLSMPEDDVDNQQVGMRNALHHFGRLQKLRNVAERLTLHQLIFHCHMSQCSEPRDLIYGLLNIAKDTVETPDLIIPDYRTSLETLFLQTMCACLYAHDRIPCLQFCDTLATRLGLDLEKVLQSANEMILRSDPASSLPTKLASRTFFTKLIRFGRLVFETPSMKIAQSGGSTSSSATKRSMKQYTIRQLPGTKSLHRMWTSYVPETTDTIFLLDFESPHEPTHNLVCTCRPIHYNANEEGVIPYRVIGLGAISKESGPISEMDMSAHTQRREKEICDLLSSNLNSLVGLPVSDSIPGYGLEVTLQELISLCAFARRTGSFVPWSIDDATASDHWHWK